MPGDFPNSPRDWLDDISQRRKDDPMAGLLYQFLLFLALPLVLVYWLVSLIRRLVHRR